MEKDFIIVVSWLSFCFLEAIVFGSEYVIGPTSECGFGVIKIL